jgi:ATP-dependent Lhr-like helicase
MALDVFATQIVGMCLEKYDITSTEIFDTLKTAYPYRDMTKDQFIEILKFLGSLRLIWLNPINNEYALRRSRKSWEYYYGNLSTIPDTRQMKIISIVQNEPIGSLDEAFIAEHGETGSTFVCKGMAWKVLRSENDKVFVEPVIDIESAIPAWEGELIPVPYAVAEEVGSLRQLAHKNSIEKIKSLYKIDKNSIDEMLDIARKNAFVPDSKNFLLETHKDFIILHSCSGTMINDTIGRYVSAVLTAETGVAVNMKTDPYRIIFQCKSSSTDVKRILEHADKLKETIELSIERSSLFKYRFLHVAKRFGIIARTARLDKIGINRIITQYADTPAYRETMREVLVDKMDIEGAQNIIEKIKKREIKISVSDKLSYFGELGLERQFSEVMKPRLPEGEIFEAFKRRLLATNVRLLCTNCANFTMLAQVNGIDEQPRCPKCKSGFIAICSKHKNPINLLKKKKEKKSIDKSEQKEIDELKRSASLVITYGKKYVIVQAGHGIGVETAARVLSRLPKDDEQLFRYIFEAEKIYARTRQYWRA